MGCASPSIAASDAGPLVEPEVRVDVFMAPLFRRAAVAPFRVDATAHELAPGRRDGEYGSTTPARRAARPRGTRWRPSARDARGGQAASGAGVPAACAAR